MAKAAISNKTTIGEFKKYILEIVEDHSGGLKFTELLFKLFVYFHEKGKSDEIELMTPEFLEKTIKNMKELKILKFTFKTLKREKMFVYTP